MAAGQDSVYSVAVPPQLIDESVANTLSAAVDMQGYDRVKFIYQLGAMASGASLSTWAVQSDESNLGNHENIMDAENPSEQIRLANVANTYNNTIQVLDIFRPSKRYVGIVADAVAANITLLGVIAERIRGTGTNPAPLTTGWQHVAKRAN